jgi:hypothetical protein
MTDREMAFAVGEYINQQLTRIAALESILKAHDVPEWREDAARILHEPAFLAVADAHIRHLQYSIPDDTPESKLIHVLHGHFAG